MLYHLSEVTAVFDIFDTLQTILWSATYAAICITSLKNWKAYPVMMPFGAGCMNFSWEVNALIRSGGLWGHWIWLALDCIILCINLRNLIKIKKSRIGYIFLTIFMCVLLWYIFKLPEGMLFSAFVINLLMAVEYVICAKRLSNHGRVLVGFLKFGGDLLAWLAYAKTSYVFLFGLCVFILNLFYIAYSLELGKAKIQKKP